MIEKINFNEIAKKLCMNCFKSKNDDQACQSCGYDFNQDDPPPISLKTGTILKQKYITGKYLGSSGFGISYAAYDYEQKQKLVIKEYMPSDIATRSIDGQHVMPPIEEFQNEIFMSGLRTFLKHAMIFSRIRHKNIANVLNYFSENNTAYMVMQFVEGMNLSDYVKSKNGKLSEKESLKIIVPVCETLNALHKENILHLNLSHNDIIIDINEKPLLIDFGEAKFDYICESNKANDLLNHGFAPSEFYEIKKHKGIYSDIYSCGALIIYMISGQIPPKANNLKNDYIENFAKDNIISNGTKKAVAKAVSKKYTKRHKTANELKRSLIIWSLLKNILFNKIFQFSFLGAFLLLLLFIGIFSYYNIDLKNLLYESDLISINKKDNNKLLENDNLNSNVTYEDIIKKNASDALSKNIIFSDKDDSSEFNETTSIEKFSTLLEEKNDNHDKKKSNESVENDDSFEVNETKAIEKFSTLLEEKKDNTGKKKSNESVENKEIINIKNNIVSVKKIDKEKIEPENKIANNSKDLIVATDSNKKDSINVKDSIESTSKKDSKLPEDSIDTKEPKDSVDSQPQTDAVDIQPAEGSIDYEPEIPAIKSNILKIAGSNAMGEKLIQKLAIGFFKDLNGSNIKTKYMNNTRTKITAEISNIEKTIDIISKGTINGFNALKENKCDICMASRRIKPEEDQDLSFPAEYNIGFDGIAIIINKSNPIREMTTNSIKDIFSGELSQWDLIGGNQGKINVYSPVSTSGTYEVFKKIVLEGKLLTKQAKFFTSQTILSDALSMDPNGIGFIALPFVRHSRIIGVLDNDLVSLKPCFESIRTEEYFLSRRLYLYSSSNQKMEFADTFINFSLSNKGQAIVSDSNFIALNLKHIKPREVFLQDAQNKDIIQKYFTVTKDAKRISLNIHFIGGSYQLDEISYQDISRLIKFIQKEKLNGSIIVIGFSDNKGSYEYNCMLALKRAKIVAKELKKKNIRIKEIITACEEIPVASNKTSFGRNKNRRVEIWVK